MNENAKIGVLTVSDRASRGEYEDLSGPAIEAALRDYIASDCDYQRVIVPDEIPEIEAALRSFADRGFALVCSTGSTGPAPRDVMPEAMTAICDKLLPGFGELMRKVSLEQVPTAILSRQTAGIVGRTLVINLPGKPQSIRICLDAVFPAVPYCIDLAGGPYLEGNPDVVTVFRPKK
ncbi:MAG: molybdopterin adenylyltransferase [Planctomycetes bacterium]|nr:molybdopterin adenylyltransferase [Planctomycetota bacterium]